MNARELIEAAKNKKINEGYFIDLHARIKQAEDLFEQKSKEREINTKFLNRVYSL